MITIIKLLWLIIYIKNNEFHINELIENEHLPHNLPVRDDVQSEDSTRKIRPETQSVKLNGYMYIGYSFWSLYIQWNINRIWETDLTH